MIQDLALVIASYSANSADMFLRTTACVATATAVIFGAFAPHAFAGEESFTSDGSWVVPAGVSVVQVNVTSGSGGDGGRNAAGDGPALGGLALTATAQVPVTPGETIYIGLGGNGQDSTTGTAVSAASAFGIGPGGKYTQSAGAGGGGGGASAVAIDDDIILIAGGGGGAGGWRPVDDFSSYSGNGGDSGRVGNHSSWGPEVWTGVGCGAPPEMGARGDFGSSSNVGTTPSTLTRTGSDGGGAGGATAAGCQSTGGGGGGAGHYGGLAGTGAGDDFDEYSGGGGGGGSSYASPSRVGIYWSVTMATRGSTPSGSIEYIDITTTALPDATAGTAFSTTLAAVFGTGGTGFQQWSVSPALPAGLSLDSSTGVLSGTASAASSASYTFTASRVTGGTVFARTSVDLALSVLSAPTPTPNVDPTTNGGRESSASGPADVTPVLSALPPGVFTWQRGIDAAVRVVANAGSASRFSVEPALPSGLSIDPTSGVIEGAPLAAHEESKFRITAVNAGGSSTAEIAISVTSSDVSAPETLMPPSVRFAPRSAKLTKTIKAELDGWLVTNRETPIALTSVIPRSGKGAALARKRAVQVRKYLRSHNMRVDSIIHLALATEPVMTRRVLFSS